MMNPNLEELVMQDILEGLTAIGTIPIWDPTNRNQPLESLVSCATRWGAGLGSQWGGRPRINLVIKESLEDAEEAAAGARQQGFMDVRVEMIDTHEGVGAARWGYAVSARWEGF